MDWSVRIIWFIGTSQLLGYAVGLTVRCIGRPVGCDVELTLSLTANSAVRQELSLLAFEIHILVTIISKWFAAFHGN